MSIIINDSYKDNKGNVYNIRDIHLEEKSDLMHIGKFITETEYKDNPFFGSTYNEENGIYLYKSFYDPNKAIRLYRDCANYKYAYHNDNKLISQLLDKQPNIKLTEFPTGVVTIENYVVGQEIHFYNDYETLATMLLNMNSKEILNTYIKIINILEELINNDIIYIDIHAKNFMLSKNKEILKLIDFDTSYISLNNDKYSYGRMITNLIIMINFINEIKEINLKLQSEQNLSDIKESINETKVKTLS